MRSVASSSAGCSVSSAGAGDDFVDGGSGDDTIYGGAGKDALYGGRGDDTIYGHAPAELTEQPADDDATDRIFGEQGDDELHGDGGDDFIDGGFGSDRLFGGAGNDELNQGYGQGGSIDGGDGDDLLIGSNDGADTLLGGAGEDRLQGLAGNDSLNGGTGADILEGGAGDDVLEGGAGADLLVGGAGNDTLYGHSVSGAGDDKAADYLYGDFGSNGNEAGSGADKLYGQGGNDLLYGEGGDDLIQGVAGMAVAETGGGTTNLIDFGGGGDDAGFFSNFPATPAPAVVPVDDTSPRAAGVLPDGVMGSGRWADLAGSSADTLRGLSGDLGLSQEPAVATGPAGERYVAWSDSRNGNLEIYVAKHDGAQWVTLGTSASQGGVSASTAAASAKPTLTVDGTGAPVVAWTETLADGSHDIVVKRWNGSAWVSLGNATSSGHAVQAKLANTANGLVLVFSDDTTGNLQLFGKIFTGGAWATLGTQAATGLAVGTELRDFSIAASGNKVAIGYSAVQTGTSLRQVYVTEFTPGGTPSTGTWAGLAGSNTGTGVSGGAAVKTALGLDSTWHAQPSVAYFGGSLFVAWQAWADQGATVVTAQLSAGGVTVRDVIKDLSRPGLPQLAAGGTSLRLVWANTPLLDAASSLYERQWNATTQHFEEVLPGQASGIGAGSGISQTGGEPQQLALAVDSSGKAVLAWADTSVGSPEILVRADAAPVSRVFNATSGATVQSILDSQTLGAGDVIVVSGSQGGFTVSATDAGVTIWGAPGSSITGAVTINGANVTLQNLKLQATLTIAADGAGVSDTSVSGAVNLTAGQGAKLFGNTFTGGVSIAAGVQNASLRFNTISGPIGLLLDSATGVQ
ncbi:MAG: hypothetical protein EOP35_21090, partial [Rubrivivax sp.]